MFSRGKKKKKKDKKNDKKKDKKNKLNKDNKKSEEATTDSGSEPEAATENSTTSPTKNSSLDAVEITFEKPKLGIIFADVIKGGSGAVVADVVEGSQAESKGIKAGQQILTIAGQDVTTIKRGDTIDMIKKATFPLICKFSRPDNDDEIASETVSDGEGEDLFAMASRSEQPVAPSTPSSNEIKATSNDKAQETKASSPSAKDSADEIPKETTQEDRRKQRLFANKTKVYNSDDRKTKDTRKLVEKADPLKSKRRKMISNVSEVVDTSIARRIEELEEKIEALATGLRLKPRDPILEPQHKRAFLLHSNLVKAFKKQENWGDMNENGSLKFYSIDLRMQRITSLKLFPKEGECPFVGKKAKIARENLTWSCVHLDASVNSITKIKNIEHFTNLRSLDLSNNHIQVIGDKLSTLVRLRELNLSNNSIIRLEGISACKKLCLLNLQGNNIPKIENLSGHRKLRSLNLSGNQIVRLEALNDIPNLTHLDLSRNQIVNAEELAFCTSISKLYLGHNNLDDLVTLGHSLHGLANLKQLNMLGNPVCEMRDYRLRVLENENIKMLDDIEIKPRLRTYLAEMERRAELEDIMEATTKDYMDSIALERESKVSFHRDSNISISRLYFCVLNRFWFFVGTYVC